MSDISRRSHDVKGDRGAQVHKHVEIIQTAAGLGVGYRVGVSSWNVLNFSLEAMREH